MRYPYTKSLKPCLTKARFRQHCDPKQTNRGAPQPAPHHGKHSASSQLHATHLQGLRSTLGPSARFPHGRRKTNHTNSLRSPQFAWSEEHKPNRLTAHRHHRSPAQNCARAAAGHALVAARRRRAQGGDAQRPVPDLHPWQPAAQRLSIQQPGDASCRGLSGAAQHHGATGLLDGRDGLGSKAGSQV